MRWIELIRDLTNGLIEWFSRWGPVMAQERKEREDAAKAAAGQVIDVTATVVNSQKT